MYTAYIIPPKYPSCEPQPKANGWEDEGEISSLLNSYEEVGLPMTATRLFCIIGILFVNHKFNP